MSWRTVVISNRCKLDYKMGYMVVRNENIQRIFLDEISVLIIENPAVALTGCLLEKLSELKIKVIFCDSKRSPYAELSPYYGSFDCSRKLHYQIAWSKAVKEMIWAEIIRDKINKQAQHLADIGAYQEALLLESYAEDVQLSDETNREGHAAKVYFNVLFGKNFSRRDADKTINKMLNYGYSIILSAFNRAIATAGYSTMLGIHHDNVYNYFNLSSDLMEPFRILIDRKVKEYESEEFSKSIKYALVDTLNQTVLINNAEQTVLNAIEIYTRSVLEALTNFDLLSINHYSVL